MHTKSTYKLGSYKKKRRNKCSEKKWPLQNIDKRQVSLCTKPHCQVHQYSSNWVSNQSQVDMISIFCKLVQNSLQRHVVLQVVCGGKSAKRKYSKQKTALISVVSVVACSWRRIRLTTIITTNTLSLTKARGAYRKFLTWKMACLCAVCVVLILRRRARRTITRAVMSLSQI